ncbi:CDP-6-deoxy-delta-3,4-glucoseen reductase [Zeimonas arvi]|uniref:CDP-6-deoxy-delta-3,4-glucoseen reductase n=1 Tax=Zeimonas arvi TaxID=2498847 RepID=A0A5C8NY06_9BURK|nr:CDP-6-deoxy-delta-3,4-glucoseen reductase [Zeimonas arvi]TXL66197.1 CDP-6-deoxy-delta-3,4-glucoseen reductase [Zeimonas arvi]
MTVTVTVQPSGRQFTVEDDEFVLDAALRQAVVLPYGCKNGACGSCKARVLEGTVEMGLHSDKALKPSEAVAGYALMCCSTPQGDITIESRVVAAAGDIPVRKMPCRIASIERAAPDVAVVKLQLPANERLQYLAGQYVELILRDGSRRSYSMATAPHLAEQLELHIRHMPGGRFTDALFGTARPVVKERDILRFEGPLGTFFLREDSDKPIVLLASGTGFAPIKAVIEHARHKNIRRPMTLYWGGRRPQDLYMNALCEQWAADMPDFRYVPVVSDALPEDRWQGRSGFVHRAVIEDFPDLSGHQVYACGAPVVIDSARRDFVAQCALPEDEFYADSFTSEADLAKVG